MSVRQIRLMVFLENMLIGFIATIGGILFGLLFAKGILLLAENVLLMDEPLNFYFPFQAIMITFGSFILLFFVISLFVSYVLRTRKLVDLIKGNKKSKGEPKANILLVILAVLLLGVGYSVALVAKGVSVIAVMLPVIIVVIIGTYFLFTQLSVYIIRKFKKKDTVFWRKTNMILLSDLSFRMKDNARTFFMVAIVSTVAFSAVGTLFGFQYFLEAGIKNANPNTFTYNGYMVEDEELAKDISLIHKTIKEENIKAKYEQTILRYYEVGNDTILITKSEDYNRFASLIGEDTIHVDSGELKIVEFEGNAFGQTEELTEQTIHLTSGETLSPNEVIYSRALPATDSYFIVSDTDFEKLPAPQREESYYAWQVFNGEEHVLEVSKKLYDKLIPYTFFSPEYELVELKKNYGLVLFVGLFIGVVFFVSAGSFLYFRLYADLDEDKQKFGAIAKIGLTEKELKKVLTRQTAILFFAPIIVALIHGAVALTALSHFFSHELFTVSILVLGTFLLIQILYFYIVRYLYTKQVKKVI